MLNKSEELQVDFITRWKLAQEELRALRPLFDTAWTIYKEKKKAYQELEDSYQHFISRDNLDRKAQIILGECVARAHFEYMKANLEVEQLRTRIIFWEKKETSGFLNFDKEIDYQIYGPSKPRPAVG